MIFPKTEKDSLPKHDFIFQFEPLNDLKRVIIAVEFKSKQGEGVYSDKPIEMSKKKGKWIISSSELTNKIPKIVFNSYFDYFVATFHLYKSDKDEDVPTEDYARLFKYPNPLLKKTVELKEGCFQVHFYFVFFDLGHSLELQFANNSQKESLRITKEGYNLSFNMKIPPKREKELVTSLTIEYNYYHNTTQLLKNNLIKHFQFSYEDRKKKYIVLNSEITIKDSVKLVKVTDLVYSMLIFNPALIPQLKEAEIQLVLFFNKTDQKDFDNDKDNTIQSMLFEIKEDAITDTFLSDSINFFIEGNTFPICVFELERLMNKLNIQINDLNIKTPLMY